MLHTLVMTAWYGVPEMRYTSQEYIRKSDNWQTPATLAKSESLLTKKKNFNNTRKEINPG